MLAAVASTSLGLWIGLVAQAGAEDGGGVWILFSHHPRAGIGDRSRHPGKRMHIAHMTPYICSDGAGAVDDNGSNYGE